MYKITAPFLIGDDWQLVTWTAAQKSLDVTFAKGRELGATACDLGESRVEAA